MQLSQNMMLKNINKITETTFKISSKRRLFNELFGKDYYDPHSGPFAYVVYTDDKKLLRGYQFHRKIDLGRAFKKELADFIRLYKPSSFKDFLFFIDASPLNRENPPISKIVNIKFKKYEIVDLTLADSHGFLLWTYQFNQLFNLFWGKGLEAVRSIIKQDPLLTTTTDPYDQLRSGLFHKRKFYWDLIKTLRFSKDLSMYDVLRQRTIKGFVHNPNIERAYLLYKTMIDTA